MAPLEQSYVVLLHLASLRAVNLASSFAYIGNFFILLVHRILLSCIVVNNYPVLIFSELFILISASNTHKKTVDSLTDSLEYSSSANIFFGWNSKWFSVLRYF